MTFAQYITRLRERLNDMRKSDGSLCSAITDDGIRWTSSKLIEIANSAIAELYRDIAVFSQSPVMKQLAPAIGSIAQAGSVSITSGVGSLPTNAMYIIELVSSSSNVYAYVEPDKFLWYKNRENQPLSEGYFFTVVWDASSSARKIYTYPATSFTATVTYILAKQDYINSDGAVVLSLSNMDDLLLDIAEREARDREHNWDRSAILDKRIFAKLGVNIGG